MSEPLNPFRQESVFIPMVASLSQSIRGHLLSCPVKVQAGVWLLWCKHVQAIAQQQCEVVIQSLQLSACILPLSGHKLSWLCPGLRSLALACAFGVAPLPLGLGSGFGWHRSGKCWGKEQVSEGLPVLSFSRPTVFSTILCPNSQVWHDLPSDSRSAWWRFPALSFWGFNRPMGGGV